jgi:hypothetical protein
MTIAIFRRRHKFFIAHSVGHHTELSARMFLRVMSASDCDMDIGT